MRPNEVYAALDGLLETRRPAYIWGPPGVGKSALVHRLAKARGLRVLDLRAVLLDPVDLRGLPTVSGTKKGERVAEWCPPSFLPLKGKVNGPGIIFADELAQAAPLVQASFMQGILDHRIGEAELDPSWVWIAASNRQEDRAGAHRVISPLLNRFIHLDLEVSTDDWVQWALEKGIDGRVRAFIRFSPTSLHDFDPNSTEKAFPTPRSWEFVSDVLPRLAPNLRHAVLAGCVGAATAAKFAAFVKHAEELPNVDDILAAPKTYKVPTSPDVLYALSGALVDRVVAARSPEGDKDAKRAAAEDKVYTAVAEFVQRLPLEYATLTVKDAGQASTRFYRNQTAKKWMFDNRMDLV